MSRLLTCLEKAEELWEGLYLEDRAVLLFLFLLAGARGEKAVKVSHVSSFLTLFFGSSMTNFLWESGYCREDGVIVDKETFVQATLLNLCLMGFIERCDGGSEYIVKMNPQCRLFKGVVLVDGVFEFLALNGEILSPEAKLMWLAWVLDGREALKGREIEALMGKVFAGLGGEGPFVWLCDEEIWSWTLGELIVAGLVHDNGKDGEGWTVKIKVGRIRNEERKTRKGEVSQPVHPGSGGSRDRGGSGRRRARRGKAPVGGQNGLGG